MTRIATQNETQEQPEWGIFNAVTGSAECDIKRGFKYAKELHEMSAMFPHFYRAPSLAEMWYNK